MTILLLAGTSDARRLAEGLAERGIDTLASFAGAVQAPRGLAVRTRVGGFGGPDGYVRVLENEGIKAVIDATHPFAASITRRTHALGLDLAIPYMRLERPGWTPATGDRWSVVADVAEAARLMPEDAVAFLATGRQSVPSWVEAFKGREAYLRVIDPPTEAFPLPGAWVIGRAPFDVATEKATFAALGVTHLVVKDAGGEDGRGKLEAARHLGLRVLIIRRPVRPEGMKVVETVQEALDWAASLPFCSYP